MSLAQIRTILVAVADPSRARQVAVERAAQIATRLAARVVLFHAAFESALSGRPFFDSRRLAKSRGWLVADRTRQLERHAARLRSSGLEVDVCAVWEDPVHEAVVRAALREKADLVVAGRHERRADRRPQLRLTDWELMRLCPRPLLLTRSVSTGPGSGSVLAALDPTHAYDKPAQLDIAIAGYAAALAAALQVELHAVHCVSNAVYPLGEVTSAQRQRMHRRVRSQLQRVVKKSGATAHALHVLDGSVADGVPGLARKLPAQIIAMGIVSRRWLERFVIGDTAESVMHDAPCDVLLIKPHTFRIRLGRSRKQAIVLPKPVRRI